MRLVEDTDFLVMCEHAVRNMTRARFVRNNRRLLKRLFLDLRASQDCLASEASETERLAISSIRLRRERIHISSELYNAVKELSPEHSASEVFHLSPEQERNKLYPLNRMLEREDGDSDSEDESDGEDDEETGRVDELNAAPSLAPGATADFLTKGPPYSCYKDNFRRFLYPESSLAPEGANELPQTPHHHGEEGMIAHGVMAQKTSETSRQTIGDDGTVSDKKLDPQWYNRGHWDIWFQSASFLLNAWHSHRNLYEKMRRPMVETGYRRIEWQCDCGSQLYADFLATNGEELDKLEFSLQNPPQSLPGNDGVNLLTGCSSAIAASGGSSSPSSSFGSSSTTTGGGGSPSTSPSSHQQLKTQSTNGGTATTTNTPPRGGQQTRNRFLALCVNKGGIYKTLAEIETSKLASDAAAFLLMKREYLAARGLRSKLSLLIRPTTLEFVQFTLWNLRGGYVSICSRPNSIPPASTPDYEYSPRPLDTPQPMPPEIFIHYLQHGEGELNPARHDWLPRLPKRLDQRVVDGHEACVGWGVHVIEGPNREVIFWLVMATVLASILLSVLWAALRGGDVQGGAALGALVAALPPVIMTAFLFRLGAV